MPTGSGGLSQGSAMSVPPSGRRRTGAWRRPLVASLLAAGGSSLLPGFVKAPASRLAREDDRHPVTSTAPVLPLQVSESRGFRSEVAALTALGLAAAARKQAGARPKSHALKAVPEVDWTGSATGWAGIRQKSILDIEWRNIHGVMTLSSLILFAAQISRILAHQAPTELEVWLTAMVYVPWIFFCWRDSEQLENHYAVTFYASCGWAVMSLSSLFSVLYQDKYPDAALGILMFGNFVFAVACLYFYGYHWTRMWRHFTQNRFRPLWIPGLLGLMCLHLLTPFDLMKRLDDPGWWKTVCSVYNDEWWWVADVRIIELFVTAAALLLIILHIQGIFTGMKNAAVVVIGTIFAPLGLMVLESTWLRASAWQHYLMQGPKYW